jgi:hypothetical protein
MGLVQVHGKLRDTKKLGLGFTESTMLELRLAIAHCLAKIYVTTNPNLVSDAVRRDSLAPLVLPLSSSDPHVTSLMQYECLLALTNLVSVGPDERAHFVSVKGLTAAHYCMFSDHPLIKTAAAEIFCNLVQNEATLDFLQVGDCVKIFVLFCGLDAVDDGDDDDTVPDGVSLESTEAVLRNSGDHPNRLAVAASGVLAMASEVPAVADKCLDFEVGSALAVLLRSKDEALIMRALFLATNLLQHDKPALTQHLMECNLIAAFGDAVQYGSAVNSSQIMGAIEPLVQLIANGAEPLVQEEAS